MTAEPTRDTTHMFKVPPSRIFGYLLLRHGLIPSVVTVALAIVALMAGIFVDLRWAIVFFMIVCLVLPMAMAYIYLYHAMRPVTSLSVLPHTVMMPGGDGNPTSRIVIAVWRALPEDALAEGGGDGDEVAAEESADADPVIFEIDPDEVKAPELLWGYLFHPVIDAGTSREKGILVLPAGEA